MSDPVQIKKMIAINPQKAEKMIKKAKQTGSIPPVKLAQLETKLQMTKWETLYNRNLKKIF
jgi:endonuclease V-like protein UPF0215 family